MHEGDKRPKGANKVLREFLIESNLAKRRFRRHDDRLRFIKWLLDG